MRQQALPTSYRGLQQEEFFAMLDQVYEDGPRMAMAIAGSGAGKTRAAEMYTEEVHARFEARKEQRRVIAWTDAQMRFRQWGLLKKREDLEWLKGRWKSFERECVSESELLRMIRTRGLEVGVTPPDLPAPRVGRPCPKPIIVRPSKTTTENGIMKLLAEAVTDRHGGQLSVYDAHRVLMNALDTPNCDKFIIVDEAQRLKPPVLDVCREPFDDCGVSIVLMGTPELETTLHRRGLESLLSRITISYHMDALGLTQVREILRGWEERLVRRIHAHSGGIFRRIANLVAVCEQIRDANGEPEITMEILDEAVPLVPDLLPDTSTTRQALRTKPKKTTGQAQEAELPSKAVAIQAAG